MKVSTTIIIIQYNKYSMYSMYMYFANVQRYNVVYYADR